MISKSIIVFWSVLCLMMFYKTGMEFLGLFIIGFVWAIVVVPTAAIGGLFKDKNREYTPAQRQRQKLILAGVGIFAFVLTAGTPNTGLMTREELRQENIRSQAELERSRQRLRESSDRLSRTWNGGR